jgi:uncharacterized protein DUF2442
MSLWGDRLNADRYSKAEGISTLEIDVGDIRPVSVAFTAEELVVTLADGRKIVTPLAWYPRLRDASMAVRGHFELMPMGIHWPSWTKTSASPACCRDVRRPDTPI